jgi:hypothetical protein
MDPSRGGTGTDRGNTWLMDTNGYDVYKEFRGDICQYIGATTTANNLKGYRLPMSYELGINSPTLAANEDGWEPAASFSSATGNANGKANMIGSSVPPNQSFGRNTTMI